MPVRWSYVMLEHATSLKKIIDQFIMSLVSAEIDCTKQQKLNDLQLSEEEWTRVESFLDLLAMKAHHITLLLLPSKPFIGHDALNAGTKNINEYYHRTAESDAYTFAMLLDPSKKEKHILKHWDIDLLNKALQQAQTLRSTLHVTRATVWLLVTVE
ncbi:hypothetical protein BU17DRAFT_65120 [Hysterangium stoloniferum]|nr:hypothetical protein BU17DRAFT_65120 [Hysterangium stoloniferum]